MPSEGGGEVEGAGGASVVDEEDWRRARAGGELGSEVDRSGLVVRCAVAVLAKEV